MLAAKTNLKVFHVKEISKLNKGEDIIFLGWMKVGKIKGIDKVRGYNLIAVCGSGTGRTAEPDVKTVVDRNKIEGIPFFYLRVLFTLEKNKGDGPVHVIDDAKKP